MNHNYKGKKKMHKIYLFDVVTVAIGHQRFFGLLINIDIIEETK